MDISMNDAGPMQGHQCLGSLTCNLELFTCRKMITQYTFFNFSKEFRFALAGPFKLGVDRFAEPGKRAGTWL
jgi:hypothetical protein